MKKAGFETGNKAGFETIGPLLPSCFETLPPFPRATAMRWPKSRPAT